MHQPDIDDNDKVQNVIQRSTGGFSTADLLLDSLGFSKAPGKRFLRINLHHLVKRIETENGKATTVVCEDLLNDTERRYSGKFIVLACGSVESPRLALANPSLTLVALAQRLADHLDSPKVLTTSATVRSSSLAVPDH